MSGVNGRTNYNKMQPTQMSFLGAVVGYGITNHKSDEDIAKKLGITDINTILKSINTRTLGKSASKLNSI
jgi:hypothetical protein